MLKKILTFSFFALLLITPLLFTKLTSELFEYNKMMFVYGLTTIITGTWILRMISEKEIIFKRTLLDIPLGLFLLSQIISTLFSIDPHTSIWGYYSRSNGGLLSIISYLLLYWAFVSNFGKEEVLKLLKAAVFSGVLVSIYAIPEHFGLSPSCVILTNEFTANCWVQDVVARVFGTIGQPNWLAALLAMLIFPTLYFVLTAKTRASSILYTAYSILLYLAFTFTYSRGATLGLIAGFFVFGFSVLGSQLSVVGTKFFSFLLISSKQSNRKPTDQSQKTENRELRTDLKLLGIIALIFILINIYFGSAISRFKLEGSNIAARPSIIQKPSGGTQLENGGTESGQIRLIVWKGALEIFKAYPIFGSGVETFAYSYYQYRPLEHNHVSEWDFLYNKAHNEYLNYLATTGAFGLLSYLLIILTLVYFSLFIIFNFQFKILNQFLMFKFSNLNLNENFKFQISNSKLLITALLAGYISYLVQNFFLFSVVNVALLFYLFPAFAFVFTENTKDLSEKNPVSKSFQWLLNLITKNSISKNTVRVLVTLVTLVTLVSLLSLWEADTYYKKGSDYNDLNNPGKAYQNLIQAVRLNAGEPLYLAELGNAAASSAIALAEDDATTSAELKDDAQFFTDLALSISPVNTTINRTAIRTYFSMALLDPAFEEKTLEVVDRSIQLSPTDPKLLHNKGIILSQFDNMKDATASLKMAIDLKPDYRDARLSLADLYIKNNQNDLAKEQLDAVLKQIPNDPDALKFMEQIK